MRAPLRDQRLPDRARSRAIARGLHACASAWAARSRGRAWARLLEERGPRSRNAHRLCRRRAQRGVDGPHRARHQAQEVPTGTEPRLVLHPVRAIVDARRGSVKLDRAWLELAVNRWPRRGQACCASAEQLQPPGGSSPGSSSTFMPASCCSVGGSATALRFRPPRRRPTHRRPRT